MSTSDLEIIHKALRELDRRSVTQFRLHPLKEQDIYSVLCETFGLLTPAERRTLFGIPIVLSPLMPENEVRIESGDSVLRIVNLSP